MATFDPIRARAELEDLKRAVNLVQYARGQGYELVKDKSCASSKCLKHPSGDKIIVARDRQDDHWIYFSVHDERDKGTIVDFVQARTARADLATVRRVLREWLGRPDLASPSVHDSVTPVERDRAAAAAAYQAAWPLRNLQHLNERGLRPETLSHPQFAGTWKCDPKYGNALFVHRDADGVSGFEKKNRRFTGFASGAEKTFWFSNARPPVMRLVVAESAIDAMSYFQLRPQPHTRYMSCGGELSPRQVELLKAAATKLPSHGEVVLAFDHDAGGDKLTARLNAALSTSAPSIRRDSPPQPGQDWNDVLRAQEVEFIRRLSVLRVGNRLARGVER